MLSEPCKPLEEVGIAGPSGLQKIPIERFELLLVYDFKKIQFCIFF